MTICVADENVVDLDTIGLRHTTNIISRASVEAPWHGTPLYTIHMGQ